MIRAKRHFAQYKSSLQISSALNHPTPFFLCFFFLVCFVFILFIWLAFFINFYTTWKPANRIIKIIERISEIRQELRIQVDVDVSNFNITYSKGTIYCRASCASCIQSSVTSVELLKFSHVNSLIPHEHN